MMISVLHGHSMQWLDISIGFQWFSHVRLTKTVGLGWWCGVGGKAMIFQFSNIFNLYENMNLFLITHT